MNPARPSPGTPVSPAVAPRRGGWRITGVQLGVLALLMAVLYGISQWWLVRRTDISMGQALSALSQPGEIMMIASENCVQCELARRWMQRHNVAFSECLIERDADCSARYQALYAPGTPLLVVRERVLTGFSPQAIWQVLKTAPQSPPQGA